MVLKGICCWGTQYCKCQLFGMTRNQNVKFAYLFIILLALGFSTLIGTVYRDSQLYQEVLGCVNISPVEEVEVQEDGWSIEDDMKEQEYQEECVVQQLQFRWSLAVSTMHFILMLCMVLRNQLSKTLNQGAWFLKLIIVGLLGMLNLFVLPSGLLGYLHMVSAYISIFWYLVQALVIVDLVYTFDNFFNELAETTPKFHLVKAVLSIVLTVAAVYLNAVSYLHHAQHPFLWISIVNSVLLVGGLLAVLLRIFRGNNLLVYSLIMVGTNTMGYFLRMNDSEFRASIYSYIQAALIVLTLVGTMGSGSNKVRTKKSSLNQILSLNTSKDEEDNRYVSSNKWVTYHYMFFAICLILPCILSQHPSLSEDGTDGRVEQSSILVYYRVGGWLMLYLVYGWSLAASRLYQDRDFNQLEHYFKEFELN